MDNKPLVSVVVIFLNAERFIQEAIESVFAQTYDDWELLLVDDGSTDSSTSIALQYAQQYPGKVRYLEHEGHQNWGSSAARNLGICHAKGEYIAFLDADDVWLPDNLSHQVAVLNSQPEAGMVYGTAQKWYSWSENSGDSQRDRVYELGVQTNTLVKPPILLTLLVQEKACAPCTCSILLRRKVIEEINGFEESFRGMHDDQVFYAKVFLQAPVFVLSSCGAKYRQHSNSCVATAKSTGQVDSARFNFLNWLEQYLIQARISEPDLWQALQKELWRYRHPVLHRLLVKAQHWAEVPKRLVKRLLSISPSLQAPS